MDPISGTRLLLCIVCVRAVPAYSLYNIFLHVTNRPAKQDVQEM